MLIDNRSQQTVGRLTGQVIVSGTSPTRTDVNDRRVAAGAVVSWLSIEGRSQGMQTSLGTVSLRFGRICQSMAGFWGCWKIYPLKTREIAKGTDKCESPVRRGLLTPPKRATRGLLFPGAETAPVSARDWRPSVGGCRTKRGAERGRLSCHVNPYGKRGCVLLGQGAYAPRSGKRWGLRGLCCHQQRNRNL